MIEQKDGPICIECNVTDPILFEHDDCAMCIGCNERIRAMIERLNAIPMESM